MVGYPERAELFRKLAHTQSPETLFIACSNSRVVPELATQSGNERHYREVHTDLAHTNRVSAMGQLTASIAHEVNQPIAAAVTNAQAGLRWLDRQPPDLEEARRALRSIVREGNRACDVIGRVRALIRKAPFRNERLEINGAIQEMIELARGEAVKKRVPVRTDFADGLPLIDGDRVQVQQVVLNLILNAIEAMSGVSKGARELLVSTARAELEGVLVAVRDSGPGLAPEQMNRLFEAFYTTKPDGMGMGLAICRSIIEAHGGRLWASANEPRGAVFQFTLPAERDKTDSAEPPLPRRRKLTGSTGEGRSVVGAECLTAPGRAEMLPIRAGHTGGARQTE